ncbi:MAG: protein kinase [Gemmatimonadetes bacterium]|nr:protein kinase [Gemmatimonadota bacterium]
MTDLPRPDPTPDPLLETLRARLGGQYAIEGLLGRGGMGSVFRARDLTLDRPVAIKVIGGDMSTNAELRGRFLQEARTVAKLRHPHIVAVYSAGDADGILYFVMELVPGESLRDLLAREGTVQPARAERILHELALALDYAHANGIVHRDVKPENILLDRETGRAMLTDFGVARALEGDGRMTGTGMILGSPRYMSPEQATGDTTLDGRSDLYALALVGHEMFTGKAVVDAGNVAAMLVKHLTETPKPLADAAANVPEGVSTAIDRALMKDRDQRWATGREMAEVIGMAWTPHGGGVPARPGTQSGPAVLRAPFRRRAALVAAIVAVVLVGTSVALWWNRGGAPRGVDPRRSYAVMPFEIQSSNRDIQWLRDGAVNMLTLALSQWSDLTVADYERTMVLVRDAGLEEKRVDIDRALEIARRAGAWTVVTGTITTTADSMRVDARLYDVASGKPLNTESRAAAVGDDPRPLFDGLARYLLGVAGGSATETVDLAAATTTSLVAYRAYLEGVRALFSWRVAQADSLFQIAIRADSSFALAWHKRSLALGWGDAGGFAYVESSQRALELSSRLPARERALVKGQNALARGLRALAGGENGAAIMREAEENYRGLIAADSGVAEAWYGLGDALFHTPFNGDSSEASVERMTGSLQAFRKTLALDSTFHLAYSHLISMYQGLSLANSGVVLDGDRIRLVTDSAGVRAAGGTAGILAKQEQARAIGFDLARAWSRADQDATQPVKTLIQGFFGAGMPDSAIATIDRALSRPSLRTPELMLWSGVYQFYADDPRGVRTLLDVTRDNSAAALRKIPVNDRLSVLATALAAAGASGSGAEVERVKRLILSVDSVLPGSNEPFAPILEALAAGLRIATAGTVTGQDRGGLLGMIARVDRLPPGAQSQLKFGAIPVAYVAYLASGDTVFSSAVRRWSPQGSRFPEFDARDAVTRGDTAAARTIAATFPRADSVAKVRLGLAGLRTVLRAEIIAELGDPREAAAQYAAMHPSRFATAFVDPGFTVYVRTFAARARLYEQIGERERAITAWEEFLRRWADGDATTETARREARSALQRLRDQPTTKRP